MFCYCCCCYHLIFSWKTHWNKEIDREINIAFWHVSADIVSCANFSNCIFSSQSSIELMKKYTDADDRFFIMDGTFRVTPHRIFDQVLVIYVRFGIKVIILSSEPFAEKIQENFTGVRGFSSNHQPRRWQSTHTHCIENQSSNVQRVISRLDA